MTQRNTGRPVLFIVFALALAAVLSLAPVPAEAKPVPRDFGIGSAGSTDLNGAHPWCGTEGYFLGVEKAQARHEHFQRRRLGAVRNASDGLAFAAQPMSNGPTVRKVGDVAVIEDDGTVTSDTNPFDLSNKSIEFLKKKRKVRAKKSGAKMNQDFGERLSIGDDDSVSRQMPFAVKFYGKKYKTLHINSDGNLTFSRADGQTAARDLSRLLNGPPRIAGLLADLDPSVTSGDAGIFYKQRSNNVQITWNEVPEFGSLPGQVNTFQITVFRSGKVLIAFGDVVAPKDQGQPAATVGVSPGGGSAVQLVDVSSDFPVAPTSGAIAEVFSLLPQADDFGITKVFLDHFVDDYDHVIVWLDFAASLGGAFAYEINVRNQVRGIGLPIADFTDLVGSDGRLESFVQMGPITQYPDNPNQVFLGTNSTLDVLGQEAGHRWLAFVRARINGQVTDEILGRQLAHWSFFMDSDASDMEGNDIQDNGGGNFETIDATNTFSALDRYIMGLIPSSQVGPMFFVRNGSNFRPETAPQIGASFVGERVDFTVDDIIAAEGERVPAAKDAPKTFKMAFVLVSLDGEKVSQASIAKLNKIRKLWVSYFKRETGGKGKVVTKLKKK